MMTELPESPGGTQPQAADMLPARIRELERALESLQRELRNSGLRVAGLSAENEFLFENTSRLRAEVDQLRGFAELARKQRADLDEAHAFIRHCEETIANCHRELARSPWHKAKRFAATLLERLGLRRREPDKP